MTCERCHHILALGDFPFCPHGPARPQVIGDELIGGFVQEHFGSEPEYFTSKRAMLQRADALGLRLASEGDKRKGSFAVTSKTLDDARALLSRGSQTTGEIVCETAEFTERVVYTR